jgi:CBS domain-containing protein
VANAIVVEGSGVMKCNEIMKRNVECSGPNDPVSEVARKMRDRDIGFVPVCEPAGKVLGTITDRDLALRVVAEQRTPNATRAQDVMTRETIACRPEDDVSVVEKLMSQHQKSRILCVDAQGRLAGVISLADLATADATAAGASRILRSVKSPEARPH